MTRLFYYIARTIAMTLASALASVPAAQAINIQFNYQFDTQNFFSSQPRRDALEAAADAFRVFTDNLTAISPSGTNTFTARFDHPGMLSTVAEVPFFSVPANTVTIYAGAKELDALGASTIAYGGPGAYSASGTQSFVDNAASRGQTNATGTMPTDFARWGGVISFDITGPGGQPRTWHTDVNTLPAPDDLDLYTVALHELGHLFGFTIISPPNPPLSFQTYLDTVNDRYSGPKVIEVHGGFALTATDNSAHWRSNVMSTTETGASQLPIMVPSISPGTRRFFTLLDYAAMDDIGWQVPQSIYDLPIPGDYNDSGTVNAADYTVWRQNFGSTSSLAADGNQSGRVDAADYVFWRDRFGASGGSGSVASVVPEPSGLVGALFFASFLWLLATRRRS